MESSPHRDGLAQRLRSLSILDPLMVPRDRRGIVLACGFVASAAIGLGTLLAAGDQIGWAYLALAGVGYLFLQTRLVPTFLWLLVSLAGLVVADAGNPSGWVELGLGLALAAAALIPVPLRYQALGATTGSGTTAEADSSSAAEVSPIQTSAKAEVSPLAVDIDTNAVRIGIRSLGQLRVTANGVELALEPRLQFLVGYLLARKVLGEAITERSALAEEIAPGVGSGYQKDRLRKQLYDLQNGHSGLGKVVVANRAKVVVDLSGVDFDLDHLTDTADRLRAAKELIDAETATELRAVLRATAGEFLAGYEQLEQQTTAGRGVAGEAVRSARLAIANARADIAQAVAEHFVAIGRGDRGVDVLTDAMEASPRQDLARLLVAAYLQSGQTRLATQARRDYDLTEES